MGNWTQKVVKEKKQTREHKTAMAGPREADIKPNKCISLGDPKEGPKTGTVPHFKIEFQHAWAQGI